MDATTLAEKINQYSEIWTEIRVVDGDGDYLIKRKRPVVNATKSRGKTPAILLEVGDDDNVAPISGAELAVKILGINPDNRVYIRYRCSDDEYASSGEHGYIIPVEEAWIGLDEAVLYAVKEHVNFKEFMHKTNTDDEEIDDDINVAAVASAVPVAFPIRRKTVPDNARDTAEDEPTFDEEEFGSGSDDAVVDNDVKVGDSGDEDEDDGFDLSILTELLGDIDLSTLPDDDEDEGNTPNADVQADAGDDDTQPTGTSNRKRGKDRGDLLLENALRELNLDAFVDDDIDGTDEIDLRVDDDNELMGAALDGGDIDDLNIADDAAIANGAMNDVSNAETETPWNPQPRKHLKIKREVIQQNALTNNSSPDENGGGITSDNDMFNLDVLDDLDSVSATAFDDEFAVDSNAASMNGTQQGAGNIGNGGYDDFDFDAPATAPQRQGLPYINNAMTPLPNMFPTQQPYIPSAEVALRV